MKDFKFLKIKIPTRKELLPIEKKWYSFLDGVKFSDWNAELKNNSYPIEIIKMDWRKISLMFNEKKELVDLAKINLEEMGGIIDKKLSELGWDKYFIKLDTRSPKDYLYDETNFGKPYALTTGYDGMVALANSYRTFEDLCSLKTLRKFNVIIRPYIDFHPKNEWRCFIREAKLVGISQYYYNEKFDDLSAFGIDKFINEIVIPNIKVSSFIADVVNDKKPILLETNPWGFSDPCLFNDYESFDGSIKIN